ncbi:hypothetical protein X975_27042, partial [Stegodyphus mimosarum]
MSIIIQALSSVEVWSRSSIRHLRKLYQRFSVKLNTQCSV